MMLRDEERCDCEQARNSLVLARRDSKPSDDSLLPQVERWITAPQRFPRTAAAEPRVWHRTC